MTWLAALHADRQGKNDPERNVTTTLLFVRTWGSCMRGYGTGWAVVLGLAYVRPGDLGCLLGLALACCRSAPPKNRSIS
jgi:hypothetical protein